MTPTELDSKSVFYSYSFVLLTDFLLIIGLRIKKYVVDEKNDKFCLNICLSQLLLSFRISWYTFSVGATYYTTPIIILCSIF